MVTVDRVDSPATLPQTPASRRLEKAPFMLLVVVALMWLSSAAESQAVLPLIGELTRQYHMNPTQAAWSLSVTGIATAATVLGLSRLADLYGMRRLLLVSLGLVVAGNVICFAAPGPALFIVGRAVCGVTAATPIFYALFRLRAETTGKVDISSGTLNSVAGIGTGVSFLIGGLVLNSGGTPRGSIGALIVVSLLVFVLAWLYVPDSDVRAQGKVDYLGSVLLGGALVCLMVGVGQGNTWGWSSPSILGTLAGAVVLFAAWAVWELRSLNPMIDLRVVVKSALWPAFLVGGICAGLGSTNSLAVSHLVQTPKEAGYGFGASVLTTGLFLVPVGVLITVGALVAPRVIKVLGMRRTAMTGALIVAADFLWFSFCHDRAWEIVVELAVFGAGYSLAKTTSMASFLRATRHGEGASVAGADNLVSLAMLGIGPTVATAILQSSTTAHGLPEAGNYAVLWRAFAAVAVVTAGLALLLKESDADQSLAPDAVRIR
ncbi:MFS transporter [Streptomyces sp. NPDC048106]|uniref:MFS transporter n=1 Tax=Streptomyces sp. NPDC048106 TaxID=3155750 RepID=UPI0034559FC6